VVVSLWKNADESSVKERHMANPTEPNANWPDPENERAQPGDVLGIERGGETTTLGETEEDEDNRRRQLEKEGTKVND
jgi:hypothetical protein